MVGLFVYHTGHWCHAPNPLASALEVILVNDNVTQNKLKLIQIQPSFSLTSANILEKVCSLKFLTSLICPNRWFEYPQRIGNTDSESCIRDATFEIFPQILLDKLI